MKIRAVRRSRKLSAQTAIRGAVSVRAISGSDRISPISAPFRPWWANHTGMYGELAPVPMNSAA